MDTRTFGTYKGTTTALAPYASSLLQLIIKVVRRRLVVKLSFND